MMYYHIRITPKSTPSQTEVELDISSDELRDRFVSPYNRGLSIVISGKTVPSGDIDRILINETEQDSTYLNATILERQRARNVVMSVDTRGRLPSRILADEGEDVTTRYITGPPGHEAQEYMQTVQELKPPTKAREVFVVHGRNLAARDALFEFLRVLDLHPLEWAEAVSGTGKPSPYIGEILDAAFSRAHAIVVLFTPDDEARLRAEYRVASDPLHETQLTGQARPNVLFEAGMAMGRHPDRTVLVELGTLRPFSDTAGLHVIRIDGSTQRRQDLAQRLMTAGCPANMGGTDWHKAGDFETALTSLVVEASESADHVDHVASISGNLQLSEEARELLVEATKDASRVIYKTQTFSGLNVGTNGRNFVIMGNMRSAARCEQAIQDLLDQGLVKDLKGKGEVFEVTSKGFEVADGLGTSQ